MFGIFKKKEKNLVKLAIQRDGLEAASLGFAKQIITRISDTEVAYQFVLEELDAARQGNESAIAFVNQSGIEESEYIGAMSRSFEAVDGADGPQQMMLMICMHLQDDTDSMVKLRTKIADHIMQSFGFGRFSKADKPGAQFVLKTSVQKVDQSEYGQFVQINNDLGKFVEDKPELPPEVMMAYGYARRFAVAGMFAQGVVDSGLVNHVKLIFKSLQQSTGLTKEFQNNAAQESLDLINSYFDGIELNLMDLGKLCHSVESGTLNPDTTDYVPSPTDIMQKLKYGKSQ
ncbi:hypothetical protein [Brumicola pallidula]|uniref:Uncharacterized protein n=1 Tax=Brumicola pallidula DSM 14239 = ACAM 615 TaxID=1121922 RepID=K6YCE0_9ALTE|nr:hypothetical protein [Glaciecola pallidula]GAC30399.1 hypothetical protein GPAL_3553 [Glaciecola pallidula DSM 14239 = ACAM 615]